MLLAGAGCCRSLGPAGLCRLLQVRRMLVRLVLEWSVSLERPQQLLELFGSVRYCFGQRQSLYCASSCPAPLCAVFHDPGSDEGTRLCRVCLLVLLETLMLTLASAPRMSMTVHCQSSLPCGPLLGWTGPKHELGLCTNARWYGAEGYE